MLPPAGGYRDDPLLGGGALYDVGCYAIAAVLLAFDWRLPRSVSARWELTDSGADAVTSAELHFDSGTATIHAGLTGSLSEVFVARGDKSTVELIPPVFTAGTEMAYLTQAGPQSNRKLDFEPVNPYQLMVENVSAAVRGLDAYLVTGAQSLAVAVVIDMIRAAAGEKHEITSESSVRRLR